MIALSLGLCKPLFRCRPAIALCHRDRAGQAARPAMSAMPQKRRLAVKMAPVAMGQEATSREFALESLESFCFHHGLRLGRGEESDKSRGTITLFARRN